MLYIELISMQAYWCLQCLIKVALLPNREDFSATRWLDWCLGKDSYMVLVTRKALTPETGALIRITEVLNCKTEENLLVTLSFVLYLDLFSFLSVHLHRYFTTCHSFSVSIYLTTEVGISNIEPYLYHQPLSPPLLSL